MTPIEDLARTYKYNLAWRERRFLSSALSPRRRYPLSEAQASWLDKLETRMRAMEAGKVRPATLADAQRRGDKGRRARQRQIEAEDDGWRDPEPFVLGDPAGKDWERR